jgi:hypothetical protein
MAVRLHSQMITEALAYLRYKRQFELVADEYLKCDVLGLNGRDDLLEIEIKTSFADLKNDKKKPKHGYYGDDKSRKFKPSKFYFMVPEELVEKVRPYVEEHFPYAGIMAWVPGKKKGSKFLCNILIKKQAKALKNKKLTDKQYIKFQKRIVSSMIISKLKLLD